MMSENLFLQIRVRSKAQKLKAHKVAKEKGYKNLSHYILHCCGLLTTQEEGRAKDAAEWVTKTVGQPEEVVRGYIVDYVLKGGKGEK